MLALLRILVLDESFRLFCGGQRANDIQVNAADEHGIRAERRRLNAQFLELAEDQFVDLALRSQIDRAFIGTSRFPCQGRDGHGRQQGNGDNQRLHHGFSSTFSVRPLFACGFYYNYIKHWYQAGVPLVPTLRVGTQLQPLRGNMSGHCLGETTLSLIVQKFGGSSVATAERIMAAARRAIRAKQAGNQVIVVVSARGDTTDELIDLAREISEHPPAREMDMLLATGEQISIALMAMAIQALGEPAISFTGAQIGIVTDSFHTKARIKNISTQRMRQALDEGKIVIVAGFQGIDENYNITTLGRGGSDTTAVALAAVMKHDPAGRQWRSRLRNLHRRRRRLHHRPARRPRGPQARRHQLRRDAGAGQRRRRRHALALASSSPRSSTCRCRSARRSATWKEPGSSPRRSWMRDVVVCGAAIVKDEARVTVVGVPDQPGVSHRVFSAIAEPQHRRGHDRPERRHRRQGEHRLHRARDELPATLAVAAAAGRRHRAPSVKHEEEVSKVSSSAPACGRTPAWPSACSRRSRPPGST